MSLFALYGWLYLTCLPHTVQFGQEVFVPMTLQLLCAENRSQKYQIEVWKMEAMKKISDRIDANCSFLIKYVSTAALCRWSFHLQPSAVPPCKRCDDPDRGHGSVLCALTADTQDTQVRTHRIISHCWSNKSFRFTLWRHQTQLHLSAMITEHRCKCSLESAVFLSSAEG